jgi:PAS domain S-box-containing protein
MKTKILLIRKMQIAFGFAILTLLAVGVFSYRAMLASGESDRWVRHTHEVLDNLKNLFSAMENMETNYQGFVLTGNEACLEHYQANIVRAEQNQKTLRALAADNPNQRRQFAALESWAAQKIQFSEMVIRLRRTEGLGAGAEVIRAGQGERIMDQNRMVIREIEDHEQQLLWQHDAKAKRHLQQTNTFLILGTLLGILIAAVAGWSVQHDYPARMFVEEALQDSEEQYRMLVGGVPGYAIFMLDPRGQVVSWNACAERIKGYKAEEIIGHNFSCFYSPEDIERGRPEKVFRMTAASGRHEEEVMRVRKDGSRFWAQVGHTADTLRSYRLHASCYLTKPVDLDEFLHVVRSIDDFWLATVELPHGAGR